jgi:hypothetical protein
MYIYIIKNVIYIYTSMDLLAVRLPALEAGAEMGATLQYDAVGEGETSASATLAYDCHEDKEEEHQEGNEEGKGKGGEQEEEEKEDPLESVEWEGGGMGKEYKGVFEELATLGQGTYGTVKAARHCNSGVEVLHSFEKAHAVSEFWELGDATPRVPPRERKRETHPLWPIQGPLTDQVSESVSAKAMLLSKESRYSTLSKEMLLSMCHPSKPRQNAFRWDTQKKNADPGGIPPDTEQTGGSCAPYPGSSCAPYPGREAVSVHLFHVWRFGAPRFRVSPCKNKISRRREK